MTRYVGCQLLSLVCFIGGMCCVSNAFPPDGSIAPVWLILGGVNFLGGVMWSDMRRGGR
jgi:hypothetical protein